MMVTERNESENEATENENAENEDMEDVKDVIGDRGLGCSL